MDFNRVFLIGAPRSGTSWLQAMLAAHPDVASPTELHLFDSYVKAWHRAWDRQAHPPPTHRWRRFRGLASVLTRQDFDAIISQAIGVIHRRVMEAKPSATVMLEKTPDYSLHVEDIGRYVPEAKFLHLIRDGRDVAASLLAASQGWGKAFWDRESIESAAGRWKSHVLGARSAPHHGRYLELRYEALRSEEGPRVLQEAFIFCDVEASYELCCEIHQQHRIDVMKDSRRRPESLVQSGEMARLGVGLHWPEGFFRRGTGGEWEQLWSRRDRWRFDRVAGDLLRALGYADTQWAEVGKLRHWGYRGMARMSDSKRVMTKLARNTKQRLLG